MNLVLKCKAFTKKKKEALNISECHKCLYGFASLMDSKMAAKNMHSTE